MTPSSAFASNLLLRKLTFGWHYGKLPARAVASAAVIALLVLAAAAWHAVRSDRQADRLWAHLAAFQSARAASTAAFQAAEPPDVIQSLPAAPGVAQVMQTLQQAADKEGAHVLSLQADDHPPTATALGHLDLVLSIKAPYPSILVVIQEALDRYPGATLRQFQVARGPSAVRSVPVAAVPAPGASAAEAMSESEAQVTLAFWRRPLGVEFAGQGPSDMPAIGVAAASAPIPLSSATPLPPIASAPPRAK